MANYDRLLIVCMSMYCIKLLNSHSFFLDRQMKQAQNTYAPKVNTINYLLSPYIYFILSINQFLRYIHATLRYKNTLNFIF